MGAVWYRARGELRRRWRATVVLIAIVGAAGGVLLTTVAGARRSSSAYERFREETLAGDLDIAFDGPPGGDLEAAAAAVRALPQVEVLTQSAFPFVVPAGSGFYPYLDFLAHVGLDDAVIEVDRPRITDGELPDPDDPEQAAISETFAREADLEVGDRVDLESYAPEQMEPLFTTGDAGPPAGPRTHVVVTAVFNAPTFLSDSTNAFQPRLFLTRAFHDRWADQMAVYPGGFTVRLENGADDVEAASAAVRDLFSEEEFVELTPAAEVDRKIESSIDVIVTALILCALIAGLAGCVAIAQALTRHLTAGSENERTLSALGMTTRERTAQRLAIASPIAAAGALLAVVVAIAASPLMPVGVARRAEPDRGVDIDPLVLGLGFLGILVVVGALSLLASMAAGRRARALEEAGSTRTSRAMALVRGANLSPPAGIGVGMALEPRSGTGWAVRSALAGLTFGVTGVVAVVVFAASVTTLVDSPDRYGSPFDAAVSGFSGNVLEDGGQALIDDPQTSRIGVLSSALARIGPDELPTFSLTSLKGGMSLTLLSGRLPRDASEVVLGTTTLEEAGVGVGDEVAVEGIVDTLEATVVGTAAFPIVDERSGIGRGALLLPEDLEAISSPDELNVDVVIAWADGVDVEAANAGLAERTQTEVFPPRLPSDVNNLRDVQELPRALAVFLALLGALAAVHALVTTVRMRRHELAVLRSLGFERRQLASTLGWQASTIGAIGLAVGVPLGLVVGRAVWRGVADSIGVVDTPVTPALAVALVALAALVAVNAAAILPGRTARRVRPATILRSG